MKNLFSIISVVFLGCIQTACASQAPTSLPITPTASPPYQIDFNQLPDQTPGPPLVWQVQIIQDSHVISQNNGNLLIGKRPFIIRVVLPTYFPVRLQVFNNVGDLNNIQGNVKRDCPKPFCSGGGIAEGVPYKIPDNLVVGDVLGFHYLSIGDEAQHLYRWSNVQITEEGIIFERAIINLNNQPVEQFSENSLYMAFWVDYRDNDFINEDELKKLQVQFAD